MGEIAGAAPGTVAEEAPRMGFFQRLTGMYFEPKKTFEDINRKGRWLGVFIIVSALVMTSSYVVITRSDRETMMRKMLQQNPFTRNLSEERIQEIVSRPVSPIQMYLQVAFAPAGVMISYLIVAGVLLLVFIIMGSPISFEKSMAATIWGMGPPAMVLLLLSIVFILVKDPASLELNVVNNVVSNLGPVVPEKEHPVLHGLLSSVDLFSFWTIFLLAVGFSAVSSGKLTTSRAAAGILTVWGIYILGKLGFLAMFG